MADPTAFVILSTTRLLASWQGEDGQAIQWDFHSPEVCAPEALLADSLAELRSQGFPPHGQLFIALSDTLLTPNNGQEEAQKMWQQLVDPHTPASFVHTILLDFPEDARAVYVYPPALQKLWSLLSDNGAIQPLWTQDIAFAQRRAGTDTYAWVHVWDHHVQVTLFQGGMLQLVNAIRYADIEEAMMSVQSMLSHVVDNAPVRVEVGSWAHIPQATTMANATPQAIWVDIKDIFWQTEPMLTLS